MKKIKGAILILGPGKSGTTLLNDMLSYHPEVYWISNYVNKKPELLSLSIFNNLFKVPSLTGKIAKLPKSPRACEPFLFFSNFISGFHRNEGTFNSEEIANLQHAIFRINRYHYGKYFLTKFTGPPRLEFIEQVFEKPMLIWLDRNPKAIIASYYRSKWRYKNRPEEFESKKTIEILKEYTSYYNYLDREKENLQKLGLNVVYYEDLVEDPLLFMEKLLKNSNLELPESYRDLLKSWPIKKDQNKSYESLFSRKDLEYLEQIHG